jgi:hypothetical protein
MADDEDVGAGLHQQMVAQLRDGALLLDALHV